MKRWKLTAHSSGNYWWAFSRPCVLYKVDANWVKVFDCFLDRLSDGTLKSPLRLNVGVQVRVGGRGHVSVFVECDREPLISAKEVK